MKDKPQILIIDKKSGKTESFANRVLNKTDFEIVLCTDKSDFVKIADPLRASLIITSGTYQKETSVITKLREDVSLKKIPVIIIVESFEDEVSYFDGYGKGPVDHIVFPFKDDSERLDGVSKIEFFTSSSKLNRIKNHSDTTELKVRENTEPYLSKNMEDDSAAFVDIFVLRKKIEDILEKNKTSAISSIEKLVKMAGGSEVESHNKRVLDYIDNVCERMRLPAYITEPFKRAAVLHDCFKYLLEKSTVGEKLSPEAKTAVESYPYMLAELTGEFDFFANERSVLLFHHENYDGSGYPEGLKGAEIPLGARIFAVTDAVVAMLSDRPYRKKRSVEEVKNELRKNAGKQFDPGITEIFISILDGKKEAEGVNEQ